MPATLSPDAAHSDRALFAAALAAFLAYAALFIYRTSFIVGGHRYFSLFDDAMVSMRYARNLAHGRGLIWNAGGERVEGYTNPLWVFFMAIVHRLPIAAPRTSLVVQGSAAALLALNLYYVRRIALALADASRAVAWGALALTASYLPINNWSLQGMEVAALVPLISGCTWLAIRGLDTNTFQRRLYVLLGIGTWIRPDIGVPFVAVLMFMVIVDRPHRRRHLAWGLSVLAVALASQTIFRLAYYGDALPNTFYLKMTGVPLPVRIARGAFVLLEFVWRANPLLFALTCVLLLRRDRRIWLLFWILAFQLAYSVYVGGDAWEYWGGSNRYICIAMPGFFILLSFALRDLMRALIDIIARDRRRPALQSSGRAQTWAFALAVGYAVVCLNSIHGAGALAEALLIRPTLNAGPGGENQRDVEQALLLREATTPEATVAVVRAGTIPYFSDRYSIDLLGKNDRYLARETVRTTSGSSFRDFRPGHMKADFAYSIGHLRPDVIVQLRKRTGTAATFLGNDYEGFLLHDGCTFVRRGSPHILWDRLPPGGCPQ